MSAALPALPAGWERHTSDQGEIYFHEKKTEAVFWTVYLQHTAGTGKKSWVDCATGKVFDERPKQDSLDRYTVCIDRHGAHVPPPLTPASVKRYTAALASLPDGWKEYKDEASGKNYYHNAATGVTSWERPMNEEAAQGIATSKEDETKPTAFGPSKLKSAAFAVMASKAPTASAGSGTSGAPAVRPSVAMLRAGSVGGAAAKPSGPEPSAARVSEDDHFVEV